MCDFDTTLSHARARFNLFELSKRVINHSLIVLSKTKYVFTHNVILRFAQAIEHSGALIFTRFPPKAFSVIVREADSARGIYLPLDEGGLFPSGCNVY